MHICPDRRFFIDLMFVLLMSLDLNFLVTFLLLKVSPSAHGTHQHVLASSSSNVPAYQAFRGMREDEVFFIR